MTIDGIDTPITVLIKHENVDGTVSVNNNATRVQLLPHIKKLSQVLSYFENVMPE